MCLQKDPDGFGVQPAFYGLDSLVEGRFGITRRNQHGLLRQDWPFIHRLRRHVDGAAGDFDAGLQCIADRVPAFERGQQGRMGVEDATRIDGEHVAGEDGAETGHGDDVDLMSFQRVDDPMGVGGPVEVGPEALPLHNLDRHTGGVSQLDGRTGTVDDDRIDVEAGLQDGGQDRSGT